MAQLNLEGSSAATILQSNNNITANQTFTFPDTGGELVVTPGTADIETTGSITTDGDVTSGGDIQCDALITNNSKAKVFLSSGDGVLYGYDATNTSSPTSAITKSGNITASGYVDAVQVYSTANASALTFIGRNASDSNAYTFTVSGAGFITASNVAFNLDPNDPTKVLDVKESIRNVQSALYRLKAAVLIPDTTVDQLRLRILEALEIITEEVD